MKLSLILSLTLLGLSSAACVPKSNGGSKGPEKTVAKPAAPATAPAVVKDHGGHHGHGRGGHGRQPPASSPAPAASAPQGNNNSNNGGNNNSNNNNNNNNGGQGGSTVEANLVPQFGIQAGVDPQNGNCQGLNGIKIPCVCPPDRNAFIAKMQEFVSAGNAFGTPVSFPTDNSLNSQITRLTTSIVTIQNFNGRPGSGCPASSTTFVGQRAALLAQL